MNDLTEIDRMVDAFLNCETEPITIHTKGRYPTTTRKMFAAMLELQKVIFERGRGAKRPFIEQEIAEIIANHERCAKIEGE